MLWLSCHHGAALVLLVITLSQGATNAAPGPNYRNASGAGCEPSRAEDSLFQDLPQSRTLCQLTSVLSPNASSLVFKLFCSPSAGASGHVRVRFGRTLLRRLQQDRHNLSWAGVKWEERPSIFHDDANDGYLDCPDIEDWGLDFLDVPHLQLVNSTISGLPLSYGGPLLQCLNCTHLTVQNLTLRGSSTEAAVPPIADASRATLYGAARFTWLRTARLYGVTCSGMHGPQTWSCIMLYMQRPGAVVIIRDSSFINNTVSAKDWMEPPAGAPADFDQSPPPSIDDGTEPEPWSPQPPSPNSSTCRSLSIQELTQAQVGYVAEPMPTCLLDSTTPGAQGFGAVLILGDQDFENTTSSIYMERTRFSGNIGGCGAGFAVYGMGVLHVAVAWSTFMGNKAAMDGGGLLIQDSYFRASASLHLSCSTVFTQNLASRNGGGGAVHTGDSAAASVHSSSSTWVFNRAAVDAGAIYVYSAGDVAQLVLSGTNMSYNMAGRHGGAVYVDANGAVQDSSTDSTSLLVSNSSLVHNNSAGSNGGGLYVVAKLVGSVEVNGNSVISNNRACKHGGGIFIEPEQTLNVTSFHFGTGSHLDGNYAGEDGGGFYLRVVTVVERVLFDGGCQLNSNIAGANGGAGYIGAAVVRNVTLAQGSRITNNTASKGNGGGLHIMVAQAATDVIITQGSSVDNNTAGAHISCRATSTSYMLDAIPGQSTLSHACEAPESPAPADINCMLPAQVETNEDGETINNGGGIYIRAHEGSVQLVVTSKGSVSDNQAQLNGGGVSLRFMASSANLRVLMDSANAKRNKAAANGGFLYVSTAAVHAPFAVQLELQNHSCIDSNIANSGEGGAFSINSNLTSVNIANDVRLVNNSAGSNGGAMSLNAWHIGAVDITGASSIVDNKANGYGGAIYASAFGDIRDIFISGSTFTSNTAKSGGGGIHAHTSGGNVGSFMITEKSSFVHNTAPEGHGGALLVIADRGNLTTFIMDGQSSMQNNTANGNGGAVMVIVDLASVQVSGKSTCNGNNAAQGGCLYVLNRNTSTAGSIRVAGASKLTGNKAANSGGALFVEGYNNVYLLENSTLSSNTAAERGGVVACTQLPPEFVVDSCLVSNNSAERNSGGAFSFETDTPPSVNCTKCHLGQGSVNITFNASQLVNNIADADGGAVHLVPDENCCGMQIQVTFNSSKILGNSAGGAGGVLAAINTNSKPDVKISVSVSHCSIGSNSAGSIVGEITSAANFGGAFFLWYQPGDAQGDAPMPCSFEATTSSFDMNKCNGGSGGAVMLTSCNMKLSNCTFSQNQATLSGGAVASSHVARRSSALQLGSSDILEGANFVKKPASLLRRSQQRLLLHQLRILPLSVRRRMYFGAQRKRKHSLRGLGTASRLRQMLQVFNANQLSPRKWNVAISSCNFEGNAAQLEYGGAIYIDEMAQATVMIEDSTLKGNTAAQQHGGALFLSSTGANSLAAVRNCTVAENYAAANAGGIYFLLNHNATGGLLDINLTRNSAASGGGGAFLNIRNGGQLTLENLFADLNIASNGDGGAVQLHALERVGFTLKNSTFFGNKAKRNGGALLLDVASCFQNVVLGSSSFADSAAGNSGGAIFIQSRESDISAGSPLSLLEAPSRGCNSKIQMEHLDLRGNIAGSMGGGVFLAPNIISYMQNITLENNEAGVSGGCIAAQGCSYLQLQESTVKGSRAALLGGGLYIEGCARVLLDKVIVSSNIGGAAGGGLVLLGPSYTSVPSVHTSTLQGVTSPPGYMLAIISRAIIADNKITTTAQDIIADICRSASGEKTVCVDSDQRRNASYGKGGGFFITGNVAGLLHRVHLARGNVASFGSALATVQWCYNTTTASKPPDTNGSMYGETELWLPVWNWLTWLSEQECWALQISDTLLPNPMRTPNQQGLELWSEDALASPLFIRCTENVTCHLPADENSLKHEAPEMPTTEVRNVIDGLEEIAPSRISPAMSNDTHFAAFDPKSNVSKRFTKLLGRLAQCMDEPSLGGLWTHVLQQPYLGLPPTHMSFEMASPSADSQAGVKSYLQLHPGSEINVHIQLLDMFGQAAVLDIAPSFITLGLEPLPPNNTVLDGMWPWTDSRIANLDPGLNGDLNVTVSNGKASWTRVAVRGWPGNYKLTFTLTTTSNSILKVAPLQIPVEILPCAVGKTLDLTYVQKYDMPTWTACKLCDINHFSLWKDTRLSLEVYNDTSYRHTMNVTLYQASSSNGMCLPCPANAECPGGAIIVPHPGYWHSAPNSTRIHQCPNPKACGRGTGTQRQVAWAVVAQDVTGGYDLRSRHLIHCQAAWYSSMPPGKTVLEMYHMNSDSARADSTPGVNTMDISYENAESSSQLSPAPSPDASPPRPFSRPLPCLFWDPALPPGHPDSYMQQQCSEGYTGNLCAACSEGYYQDADFNCAQCPTLTFTVGLGLLSFLASVLAVLVTVATNLMEGFGEPDQQLAENQMESRNRIELGDVVKVIVLHIQYLVIVTRLSVDYPGVIIRCQAALSAITGAENYFVYSPSCLLASQDSAGQGQLNLLAGLLTPCAITLVSMLVWTLRYVWPCHRKAGRQGSTVSSFGCSALTGFPRFAGSCVGRHRLVDQDSVEGSGTSNTHPNSFQGDAKPNHIGEPFRGIGLRASYPGVQVVALDVTGAETSGGGEVEPEAAACIPAEEPPPLTTAASKAAVVDFDGMDLGNAALAPDPPTLGTMRSHDHVVLKLARVYDVTTMPEEGLDEPSDLGTSSVKAHSTALRQLGGDLHRRYDIMATVGFSGGVVAASGSSVSAIGYPDRLGSSDMGPRKTPRTLSHMGSLTLKDAMGKIRTMAANKQQSLEKMDKALTLREQLGVVLMAAVFILYPSWAHAALSTFACYTIDDGRGPFPEAQQATWPYGYWVRDMQAECYSGKHLRVYVPIGIVAVLVFCITPPLASFWFVWRIREQRNETHVQKVYGFLYKRYKEKYIWWETVLQLETLALVTVEVLGRGLQVSYQALLLLAVFTIIAVINVSCAPLLAHQLLIMECSSLMVLSLTITLSLYFTVDGSLQPAAENALAIIIIAVNTGLMLYFLSVAIPRLWPSLLRKSKSGLPQPPYQPAKQQSSGCINVQTSQRFRFWSPIWRYGWPSRLFNMRLTREESQSAHPDNPARSPGAVLSSRNLSNTDGTAAVSLSSSSAHEALGAEQQQQGGCDDCHGGPEPQL